MNRCTCGGEMLPVPIFAFTRITPCRMSRCGMCFTMWAEFTVPGREPVVLNLSERPPDMPFSGWVEEQLARKTAN